MARPSTRQSVFAIPATRAQAHNAPPARQGHTRPARAQPARHARQAHTARGQGNRQREHAKTVAPATTPTYPHKPLVKHAQQAPTHPPLAFPPALPAKPATPTRSSCRFAALARRSTTPAANVTLALPARGTPAHRVNQAHSASQGPPTAQHVPTARTLLQHRAHSAVHAPPAIPTLYTRRNAHLDQPTTRRRVRAPRATRAPDSPAPCACLATTKTSTTRRAFPVPPGGIQLGPAP